MNKDQRNTGVDDSADGVELNPAGIALDVRATPVTLDDDRLEPDCSLNEFPDSGERARAIDLGAAAQHATLGDRQGEVDVHRARSDGLEALMVASDQIWTETEQSYRAKKELERHLDEIPDAVLTAKRKLISMAGKPGFVIGDTCVIASLLWRSGTNTYLSLATGLATSLAMVSIGSMYGKTKTELDQRNGRGGAPDDCPKNVIHLYAPQSNAFVSADQVWLILGVFASLGLLVALTAFGRASGEPAGIALFAGILGALSLPGSAALEAYGTNAAADLKETNHKEVDGLGAKLHEFARYAHEHRSEAALATGRRRAVDHAAAAAGISTAVVASRDVDNPRIFGYEKQAAAISTGIAEGPEQEPAPVQAEPPTYDRRHRIGIDDSDQVEPNIAYSNEEAIPVQLSETTRGAA